MRRVRCMRCRAAAMAALLSPGDFATLLPPGDFATHTLARHGRANPGQPPARTRQISRERDHPLDDQGFVGVLASNAAVLSGL